MEESANFIPLGLPKGEGKKFFEKKNKIEGQTKTEYSRIAREVRNAKKKEHKQAKAEAKRQRAQNAILHRRMTKNSEKYSKNKDRNQSRAMDQERRKIRMEAVHQAERMAARYDPSGKTFNVGEVVVLEDGSVKSKDTLAKTAAAKAQREADKAQREAYKDAKAAEKAARRAARAAGMDPIVATGTDVNPGRASLIVGSSLGPPPVSKKQQEKRGLLEPGPPPPRPIIPQGFSLPVGEENFIAMWDITDEDIKKRMSAEKRVKALARKNLRRAQKDQKQINKAMKLLKRQWENRGEKWDKDKALKQVVEEQKKREKEKGKNDQDSSPDDDSENEEYEDVEDVEEPAAVVEIEKQLKKSKVSKKEAKPASNGHAVAETSTTTPEHKEEMSKRPAEDVTMEDLKPKKPKKSKKSKLEDVEVHEAPAAVEAELAPVEKKKPKVDKKSSLESVADGAPKLQVNTELSAEDIKQAKKEKKRAKKEKKREGGESAKAAEATPIKENPFKKRKHQDDEAEDPVKKEKSHKKKKTAKVESSINGPGEQWNPDALNGDATRKEKFLRLLGAGKTTGVSADDAKHKSSAMVEDIAKVQSELERQYELGMKMKHDGGSKKRGLGA